jgi:hypothetical protein
MRDDCISGRESKVFDLRGEKPRSGTRNEVAAEWRQSRCELWIREAVCWQICWHFSFFRSCQLEKSLIVSSLKFGSRGRIRTYDQSVNSRPLYH